MINLINKFNRQLKQDRIMEIGSANNKPTIIEIVIGSIALIGAIITTLFLVIIL